MLAERRRVTSPPAFPSHHSLRLGYRTHKAYLTFVLVHLDYYHGMHGRTRCTPTRCGTYTAPRSPPAVPGSLPHYHREERGIMPALSAAVLTVHRTHSLAVVTNATHIHTLTRLLHQHEPRSPTWMLDLSHTHGPYHPDPTTATPLAGP